jgi:hypothetical protein
MSQTVRFKLLDAVSITGDSNTFDLDYPVFSAGLQLEITGSPTRVAGTLLGLIDGATYDILCEIDTDEGYTSGEVANLTLPMLVRRIKFNVSQIVGGRNPTVSAYFAGRS